MSDGVKRVIAFIFFFNYLGKKKPLELSQQLSMLRGMYHISTLPGPSVFCPMLFFHQNVIFPNQSVNKY